MAMRSPGEKIGVAPELCPVDIADTKLIGEHNRENLALAYAAAMFVGVEREACVQAFKNFEPLPHRLQSLGVHHGVEWVDDAISTTPESTIAALRALGDKVKTLILGGQDRGLEFDELAKEIVEHSKVETIIIFPGSGPRMREAIEKQNSKISFADASTMQDAVTIAKEKTPKGTICLLSTASPSYNMFKNFEEKGDAFAQAIKK